MSFALKILALAFLAFVAFVVVRPMLDRNQVRKQYKTMDDLRTIATAIEDYSIGTGHYPTIPPGSPGSVEALALLLEPTYVASIPRRDAWGRAFVVESTLLEYTVTSFGRDGLSHSVAPYFVAPNGGTTDFRADILFSTGSFVAFPDSTGY